MVGRKLVPSTTSSATFFRALAIASVARSCPHTLRNFTSSCSRSQSSKRELYTAPSYQPHSMPTDLPMIPRNIDAPETTLTGPRSRRSNLDSKVESESSSPQTTGPSKHTSSETVTETEAQQSKPVAEQKTEKPKRRSKLKARKAAMKISAPAVEHLRELIDQPNPQMIRVGVKNRGCSGLAYHLEYVDKPAAFDEVVEQDGVKVLIDSKALFSIIGSEMDWEEDQLSARFVFRNPNITEQCGCGESFSVS
ncbi:uncharacterized protein HMPREF1541_11120 [Cyphellophora europaea CBS 101466]|uniref:Iron-sulfur assembly protein 1 n=1 Tax=Cyphellophora europaea (strain CBS 101466) TaxID=1220924 RepID=W2S530_CYPE1|nr:uncharacterized protein HMPREF1541_11120 [Cyphellophora europaea CBS 101466]ETN43796.1 hypothetical protein HMPREF1541_11120 [Cyphellophora europaea CBS 101466]